MKTVGRQQIIKVLSQKGFVIIEKKRHLFLVFTDGAGRQSDIRTFLSRGSGYNEYSLPLLKVMKNELRLERLQQLEELLNCPLSEQDYRALLVTQGDLT